MDSDLFELNLLESAKIYDYLLNEFRSRSDWLRLNDEEIDDDIKGLSTVLMDDVINHQFIEKYNKEPDLHNEWKRFFDFIEELQLSGNSMLIEDIDTTLLEVLASETYVDLESILPYCGVNTRRAIYKSISDFYGRPERAEELKSRFG